MIIYEIIAKCEMCDETIAGRTSNINGITTLRKKFKDNGWTVRQNQTAYCPKHKDGYLKRLREEYNHIEIEEISVSNRQLNEFLIDEIEDLAKGGD